MTSQYENEVMLTCAMRGFHYYRKERQSKPAEMLNCRCEQNHVFDRFAIKTLKTDSRKAVRHVQLKPPEQKSFYLNVMLKSSLN